LRDFSFQMYRKLVFELKKQGYQFQCFEDFIQKPLPKVAILRHDVDAKAYNSLRFAEMEKELDIRATYYFRMTKHSFVPRVIRSIVKLGHEIGYHYEDLSAAHGNMEQAISSFKKNLEVLRTYYPIKTICMHGKSMSVYDNRSIWNIYNYHDFDLIAEPYFDVDYDQVLYLTDTAQCWNGSKIALRDKVTSNYHFSFTTTKDILDNIDKLPDQLLFTIHPQRWTDNIIEWIGIRCFVMLQSFIKVHYLQIRTRNFEKRQKHSNYI
jgi:hypothetical protein